MRIQGNINRLAKEGKSGAETIKYLLALKREMR